jgi:hypothetical protein
MVSAIAIDQIAKLGFALLLISQLLNAAAMLQIPRNKRSCFILLALAYAALTGAIACVAYETSFYGF